MKYPKAAQQEQQESLNSNEPWKSGSRAKSKSQLVPPTPGGSQSSQSSLNNQHPAGLYKGKRGGAIGQGK